MNPKENLLLGQSSNGGKGSKSSSLWKKRFISLCIFCFTVCFILFCSFYKSVNSFVSDSTARPFAAANWNYTLEEAQWFAWKNLLQLQRSRKTTNQGTRNLSFERIFTGKDVGFSIEGSDVIVFLHIQKTAGTTFEKFLVQYLDIEQPCRCHMGRKRCKCHRPHGVKESWIFSRFSTGWSCGLHADWTELVVSNCVDNVLDKREKSIKKRRYFYTTFLRDPSSRYISEFRHVQRGATWGGALHLCNGRPPSPQELPLCFDPDQGWDGVSLDEFLSCPHNLANNRQTRMLADLTLVGCYNRSAMEPGKRDTIMLESAKKNLENLAFYGLQEEMDKSQFIFEQIFDLRFIKSMSGEWRRNKSRNTDVNQQQRQFILDRNHLDVELYRFATDLFQKRYKMLKTRAAF